MFGSGGAFGSSGGSGGFGNQPKPTTTTFGGFGQSSNSGTTAFGSTSTTGTNTGFGSAGTGAFGRSSGSGGFGSTTGTFGSGSSTGGSTTGGFGSTTGGFGSSSTGGGGSVFGQAAQPSGSSSLFGGGGGSSGFGTSAAATGTARVNYEPTIEMTANGKRDIFDNICFMNAYKDFSPEELRLQDYEAGRKKPDAVPGSGGFGQTASTGGSGAFGQSAGTTTGAFGQSPAASGSGGTTGMFSSSGGFGQTSGANTGFGQTSTGSLGFGQTSSTAGGGFGGGFSGGTGIGGFGQTAAAGGGNTGMGGATTDKPAFGQAPTGAFGSGGGFGSTSTAAPTSGFGASSGFGATSGTGAFGSSTGGFGQQSSGTTGFGSSSGFGAKPAFGAFGATNTSQPPASTGGFGQTSTGGGGFGANTGGSAFGGGGGSTGMFGTNTGNTGAGTGGFGTNTGTAASGGGGFFNKPAETGGGIFGNTGGSSTGTGIFGTNTAAGNNQAGTGAFGTTGGVSGANTGGSLFGNTGANAAGGGSSLFGVSKPAGATGTTGSMFNSTSGAGGGLGFGASGTGTGGNMFGGQNTGGLGTGGTGLFNTGGNAATGGAGSGAGVGMFGGAGASNSLFGAKPAAAAGTGSGNMFGSGTGSTGFGLGAASNQGTSLFGGQAQQPSLFGQPAQQQQQQPAQLPALQTGQLAAQIDKQPYGVSALFDTSRLANKAAAARTGHSHLTATPLRASIANQALGDKEAENKKRGLNLKQLSTPHTGKPMASRVRSRRFEAPNSLPGSMTPKVAAVAPRTPAGKGREVSGLFGRDGFLSPESQLPHSNVKRLVITRKPSFGSNAAKNKGDAEQTKGTDGSPQRDRANTIAGLETARMSPSPLAMDNPWADTPRAARVHSALSRPKSSAEKSRRVLTVADSSNLTEDTEAYDAPVVADEPEYGSEEEDVAAAEEDEDSAGKYWMRPPLEDLRAMTTQQLRGVRNLTVGRNGVGQVSFGKAVDLTTVGSLGAIAGGVVLFSDRVCTVYPDESNKPARGHGLNVPATISLHNCWPVDRATGEPIEHMDDPRVRKHIRRLRRIEETEFVDFVDGTWIFRVEHFSRYGLDDNHEDGFDDEDTDAAGSESHQQGFGKATASSALRAQSRLGGSDVVAQQQQPSTSLDAAARRHVSFDVGLLDSSGSDTDILASTSHSEEDLPGSSQSDAGMDDQSDAPTPRLPFPQRPPPQLLLGTRHADALRRAPVMRASLFSTGSSTGGTGSKRPAESTGAAASAMRPAFLGRVQSRSPAVSQPLHAKGTAQPSSAKSTVQGGRRASRLGERRATGQSTRSTTASLASAVSVAALDLPPPSKYLRTSETDIARTLLAKPQPYVASLTHGRSGVSADAGLMMARSFRVAFGPQGQLVYLRGVCGASSDADAAAGRFGRGASSVVVVDNIARHLHAAPGAINVLAACTSAEGDGVVPASCATKKSAAATLEHHRQLHLRSVRAQWEHALVRTDCSAGASCPRVSFREDTSIASVLASLRRTSGSSGSVDVPADECRVMELASVLFDTLPQTAGDNEDLTDAQRAHIAGVCRRQALTRWLEAAVAEHVQLDLLQAGQSTAPAAAAAAAVFALLSGHRIEAACLAATSHRDYRLATLVAQCGAGAVGGGGNDNQLHVLVRAQLDRIAATTGQGLSPAYRRVYELVSGNAQWVTCPRAAKHNNSSGSANTTDQEYVAAGIDWKRAFGLGLWYVQSPADPVADAVVMYEREVERGAPVAPPLPAWLFSCSAAADQSLAVASVVQLQSMLCGPVAAAGPLVAQQAVDLMKRGVWDSVFQLLKLYGTPSFPLEAALLPEAFTPARGDVRLPAVLAWLLATVRACRGFDDARQCPDSTAVVSMSYNRLLADWALQLEALGQWHWACFVLLQLNSLPHKEHAIRALLERSLPNALPTSTLAPSLGADLFPPGLGVEGSASIDQAEEQVRFVLYELQLPRAWLYDAYATRARYDRDLADIWAAQSHRLMRKELAADTVGHFVHADETFRRTTASGRSIVPSYFSRYKGLHGQPTPLSSRALSGSSLSAANSLISSSFGKQQQQQQQPDSCAIATLRQVAWLLSAGRFASAHAVVLQRIAPDAILRGDHRLLARIFALVDPTQHSDGESGSVVPVPLDEWATGGQVFLAFVAAIEELPEVLQRIAAFEDDSANGNVEDMEVLTQRVRGIYHRMSSLLAALPALLARFDLSMPLPNNNGSINSAAALASVVDSERTCLSTSSVTAAATLGFYEGDEANWFAGEESCELRVKHLVAVSDMASIVTGLIRELEQCVPGLASSSSSMDISDSASLRKNTELFAGNLASSSLDSMDDVSVTVDSALLPLAQDMRILRTHQLARSCFDSLVTDELEV